MKSRGEKKRGTETLTLFRRAKTYIQKAKIQGHLLKGVSQAATAIFHFTKTNCKLAATLRNWKRLISPDFKVIANWKWFIFPEKRVVFPEECLIFPDFHLIAS